jgi:glucose-1-phosphate adenylyltransferase
LRLLTKNLAKPAVPFGGKYRIIDFSLSNCINSGISTVGVLTQYKPQVLNSYIGVGTAWDLHCNNDDGGVTILPPYVKEDGGEWYKGTADSVYQNINFMEKFDPKYVLVISGDHVYKMDYSLMLEKHKEINAEVSISVVEVPWEEAPRFGIMNTDQDGLIIQFEEKPRFPKSNLASMGVYIFNWEVLKAYLLKDAADHDSANDFGKNVIPRMLREGLKMYAYPFKGYWRDVGTVESYWEASMDMLNDKEFLDFFGDNWCVYSAAGLQPPHYTAPDAKIKNALVSDGCYVHGEINHSILFSGVHVGRDSSIKDSIIMAGARIGQGAKITKAVIGENAVVGNGSVIGGEGITVIQEGEELREKSQVGVVVRNKMTDNITVNITGNIADNITDNITDNLTDNITGNKAEEAIQLFG